MASIEQNNRIVALEQQVEALESKVEYLMKLEEVRATIVDNAALTSVPRGTLSLAKSKTS